MIFFWLGDGFVNQELSNTLYVFAYHIERTGEHVYDFVEPNVSLMALGNRSSPPYVDQRQLTTPLHVKIDSLGEGNLGSGILVKYHMGRRTKSGWLYICLWLYWCKKKLGRRPSQTQGLRKFQGMALLEWRTLGCAVGDYGASC